MQGVCRNRGLGTQGSSELSLEIKAVKTMSRRDWEMHMADQFWRWGVCGVQQGTGRVPAWTKHPEPCKPQALYRKAISTLLLMVL